MFLDEVVRRSEVGEGQRFTASKAQLQVGFLKILVQSDALIEDETISIPVRTAGLLEISQNSAIQLVDILPALILHHDAGLLTADSTGAEHDDGNRERRAAGW